MNILFLSFYFEPDLSAGSFRNTSLAKELIKQVGTSCNVDIITSMPNRYASFKADAPLKEVIGNTTIYRVQLPTHKSGMIDQITSYKSYFTKVLRITKKKEYDLIYASSSRLFTAYLGHVIAKKQKAPLYLDIRDIFVDTMKDVLKNGLVKSFIMPFLKIIEKRTFSTASHINLISEGFKPYFEPYTRPNYSFFTNGIDDMFLNNHPESSQKTPKKPYIITYAGNIGEGQGLHKIIPESAQKLGDKYKFKIIGDGGAKNILSKELNSRCVTNVELLPPVSRNQLMKIYSDSDFLFIHLNDFDAFKKVLPSKLFELATFDKPIIAGVGGFANIFIRDNLENVILFDPCDVSKMVALLQEYKYKRVKRSEFTLKYSRERINKAMAMSVLQYLR